MKVLFFPILFICFMAKAQVPTLDINGASAGGYGQIKFNNPATIGQKNVDKLTYDDVRGKCFWDNDWRPALLVLKGGNAVKMRSVKLNFYTNDIHYIDNNQSELVAQNGLIKKIIFYSPKDTSKIEGVFQALLGLTKDNSEHYFQVLNEGKIQLLKNTAVTIHKDPYDPSLGKSEFRFVSSTEYFIKDNTTINPVKSFNKTNLSAVIKPTISEEWLKSTKNKLKNEDDVVALLNFLNSEKK